jgi:hypothetical protein
MFSLSLLRKALVGLLVLETAALKNAAHSAPDPISAMAVLAPFSPSL